MKTLISTLVAAATFAVVTPAQADDPHTFGRATINIGFGVPQGVPHGVPHSVPHGGFRHHPLEGLREINLRQAEQRDRIEHGFRRGVITHREYGRLMAEQQNIQSVEHAFVADGFLAPRERMELHRRLDMASQNIFAQAHDRQRRF